MSSFQAKFLSLCLVLCLALAAAGGLFQIYPPSQGNLNTSNAPVENAQQQNTAPAIPKVSDETQAVIDKIAPHKALYRMSIAELRAGSPVSDITGYMYYKWEDSCDAWSTDHRFNIKYSYTDRPSTYVTRHFVSWEAKTGHEMSFFSNGYAQGIQDMQIRGKAKRFQNAAGQVTYTTPEGVSEALPIGVLFPAGHTIETIKAARQGKTFFNAAMFDGTDDDGPLEVNVFINSASSQTASKAQLSAEIDNTLLSGPAWDTRLAFFRVKGERAKSALPAYEMDIKMHENGIVSQIIVGYDKFSVKQELVALSKVSKPEC